MTAIKLVADRTWRIFRVPFLLLVALVAGHQAGDWHWPYNVQTVEVDPEIVRPGGTVGIIAVRNYYDDCTLMFSRRLESVSSPHYRPVMLPEEVGPTPWEDNGKPRTTWFQLPMDFPCGAAQMRTSPSAACNLLQLYLWSMHQPDRLTPFDVTCGGR